MLALEDCLICFNSPLVSLRGFLRFRFQRFLSLALLLYVSRYGL